MPSRPWLGDLPAGGLLDAMARPATCPGVARASPAALVVRARVLEIRLAGMPVAGRERTGAIADLDQVPEPVTGLVAVRLVPVVTLERGHFFEAHGEPPAAGNDERPRPVAAWRPGSIRRPWATASN